MFGLIRILLLLVIIAAVALLIRPDLIELTGLSGSKPVKSEEKSVSTPVAEQQVSETATTIETGSPEPVEQPAEQTTEKTAVTQSAVPEEPDAPQESAPAHDPETLRQSDIEWGFDSSQETSPVAENRSTEPSGNGADTAAETDTPHDPETLKQSDVEWGFDSSQEAIPDAGNAAPEESAEPQKNESETTDPTPDEAALRQEVEELLNLAADIIDNPEQ